MNSNWEQFETTGSVEDYLSYRRHSKGASAVREQAEKGGCMDRGAGYGTDSGADRPGIGGISLRGL